MVKEHASRQRSIKSKLMAAISMLLVSTIMMVSSTYAWFTLSTAPEVTGITTAVGANGNLEMALLTKDGVNAVKSEVGDGSLEKPISARNITWGNLVDVSDTTVYGLDKIKLLPAALNVGEDGKIVPTALLQTPEYGADGRVSKLEGNTVTGIYANSTFVSDDEMGVRAVGRASGMTDRQLSYRNAAAAASTAMSQAKNTVTSSLTTNGAGLADLAIKHGLNGPNETYTVKELEPLKAAVNDLDTVVDYIEEAYMQYILTFAASSATGEGTEADVKWSSVKGLVEASDATLSSVVNGLTGVGVTLSQDMTAYFQRVYDLRTAVTTAQSKLDTLVDGVEWSVVAAVLDPLMDSSQMNIEGLTVAEVKANPQVLVDAFINQGSLTLNMVPGSGVYADIADQCGDYIAGIKISVTYNGMPINNAPANMKTATNIKPAYLEKFGSAAKQGEPTAEGTVNPISDFYGFVIDLGFRTNAANSNLMLQVDPTDRIYSDNDNEETMGHGSSMTFKAGDASFTNDQMAKLMDAIRVVFFDPDDGEIIKRAKLAIWDKDGNKLYSIGTEGITAKLSLCKEIGDITYDYVQDNAGTYKQVVTESYPLITEADGDVETKYSWDNDQKKYVVDENGTYKMEEVITYELIGAETVAEANRYKQVEIKSETAELLTDRTIMALNQNAGHAVSVLVYLDGNKMTNADVATGATSMTGSMSLQFSSDANLIPMEYAALHTTGSTTPPADDETNDAGNTQTTGDETTGA